jgi:hypothetical protein
MTKTKKPTDATADQAPVPPKVTNGPEESSRPQFAVDDSKAHTTYSTNCVITATSEEIVVGFVRDTQPVRGTNGTAVLPVESKVIMSPWAAKRLVIALAQTLRTFEDAYGELEIDPRKRMAAAAPTQ